MNRTAWLGGLTLIACTATGAPAGTCAKIRGPREVFPVGVYVSGNNPAAHLAAQDRPLEEQIEFTCRDLKAHHFNAVWLSNLSPQHLPAWLRIARKYGIRVIPQGGGMPMYLLTRGWWATRWEAAIDKRVKPFYRQLGQTHRNDPALLAYSIVEEIPADSPLFPHIRAVTREMATVDPNHPVIVLYNRASAAVRAAREIRPVVIGYDCYPFFKSPRSGPVTRHAQRSYYEGQIARFSRAARECGAVLWVMAQSWHTLQPDAQGKLVPTEAGMRKPTLAEMRWQMWSAVFHGAKGLFFYAYSTSPKPRKGKVNEHLLNPQGRPLDIYDEAARVSRAMDPIKPLLLRLAVAPYDKQVVYWENLPDIHGQTFVHQDTGDRYLMVLNSDVTRTQPIDLEFGYFQQYLRPKDRFYEVLSGKVHDTQSLRGLSLEPGTGALFLIGQDDALARHRQWMARQAQPPAPAR